MRVLVIATTAVFMLAGCQQLNTPKPRDRDDAVAVDQRTREVLDRQSPDYRDRVRKGELSGY